MSKQSMKKPILWLLSLLVYIVGALSDNAMNKTINFPFEMTVGLFILLSLIPIFIFIGIDFAESKEAHKTAFLLYLIPAFLGILTPTLINSLTN